MRKTDCALALLVGAFWIGCASEPAPPAAAAAPVSTPTATPRRTTLLFGGDVILARGVGLYALNRNDPAAPLRDLAPVLAAADITFVNLESPFSETGTKYDPGMIFRAAPEMIEALTTAGIDVVSTANNHARDAFAAGVPFTLDWLRQHGIAAAGSGHTPQEAHRGTIVERNGVRFGFLAYTYDQRNGNYPFDDDRIALMDERTLPADIAALRETADVVIVSMHAGVEYYSKAAPQQVNFAHTAIDAGASLVVGHHPHVVQPVEVYGNGIIIYSLGNLLFDQFQRKETQQGLLAEVRFRGKTVEGYQLIPIDIFESGPRLRAVPATVSDAAPKSLVPTLSPDGVPTHSRSTPLRAGSR